MTITPDLQLSQELQELYLENREWCSQLLFLEDEYRFFHQLFQSRYAIITKNHSNEEVTFVDNSLVMLKKQIELLKALISKHQHLLETIIKDQKQLIGIELIEETSSITTQINNLLVEDKKIKKELFELLGTK